tara:strand:- start:287 stop:469 length:183 start_codon:yes stop_codon:yes gene_type:complete
VRTTNNKNTKMKKQIKSKKIKKQIKSKKYKSVREGTVTKKHFGRNGYFLIGYFFLVIFFQ